MLDMDKCSKKLETIVWSAIGFAIFVALISISIVLLILAYKITVGV